MKKPYRPPRELLAELDQILARRYKPSDPSPLDQAAELLLEGRHYSWTGVYLAVEEPGEREASRASVLPETRSELVQPIKLAGRTLGVVCAVSDRPDGFSQEDRVLLKEVAERLARFLTGRGKYLARKAREAAARAGGEAGDPERHQPASERGQGPRAAAAGEKSRS